MVGDPAQDQSQWDRWLLADEPRADQAAPVRASTKTGRGGNPPTFTPALAVLISGHRGLQARSPVPPRCPALLVVAWSGVSGPRVGRGHLEMLMTKRDRDFSRDPLKPWSGRFRRSLYRPRRFAHWKASAPPPPPNGWDAPVGFGYQLPVSVGVGVGLLPADKTESVALGDSQPAAC